MIESKLRRVERPDDPRRCQAVFKYGQCPYEAMEHSTFCASHGGNSAQESHRKTMHRKYQLAQWQARTGEFADDDQIKSLREEIGILRMTLENVVAQCKSPMDVVLWSGKIGDLVGKIEKIVVSCNRLEASTGMLLDKGAALALASQMVGIIGRYVTDPDAIDAITNEIIQAFVKTEAES